jgi:hypothetical protein
MKEGRKYIHGMVQRMHVIYIMGPTPNLSYHKPDSSAVGTLGDTCYKAIEDAPRRN